VPIGTEASADLSDEAGRVWQMLHDEDREDAPERRVREAQRYAQVGDTICRIDAIACCPFPSDLDHARRTVKTDNVVAPAGKP
jgi:hypothetical protein